MSQPSYATPAPMRSIRLACITLVWMLVELGISAYAAFTAHSAAMLAFGSDSLVETLSAATVLSQWIPRIHLSERRAARIAGGLLMLLAAVVTAIAVASYVLHVEPEKTVAGISITAMALFAMPLLARMKRREAARTGNAAMRQCGNGGRCSAIGNLRLYCRYHAAWARTARGLRYRVD